MKRLVITAALLAVTVTTASAQIAGLVLTIGTHTASIFRASPRFPSGLSDCQTFLTAAWPRRWIEFSERP